jgi:hypothetical protein
MTLFINLLVYGQTLYRVYNLVNTLFTKEPMSMTTYENSSSGFSHSVLDKESSAFPDSSFRGNEEYATLLMNSFLSQKLQVMSQDPACHLLTIDS